LGPRFGPKFPQLREALNQIDPAQVAASLQAGQPVSINLDGDTIDLAPEEIIIQIQPAAGLAVAADKVVTVAVETHLTPELRAEGLAREIVRRIQAMRKDAGFNIEDRITVAYQAEDEMAAVMVNWGDYIRTETLATELISAEPAPDAYSDTQKVEGQTITIAIKRVQA
jgi:isoleucyl-tRNA synthetase